MTQVFGYMRFSFLGRNDTKIGRGVEDTAERMRILYDPARMEERFHFLERITLPSLRAQTDPDFRLVIVSSPQMPDPFRERLASAIADLPQAEILWSEAAHVTHALDPWIERETAGATEPSVHFRLDDDDAIAAPMISWLKELGRTAPRDAMISFPRGFYLGCNAGEPLLLRKFEPYIAIAWAFVNAPGQVRNPYAAKHGGHYMNVPSVMDPREHAYIHVHHESSDTRGAQDRKLKRAMKHDPRFATEKAQARIARIIEKNFPCFTPDGLKRIVAEAPGQRRKLAAE